MAALADTVCAAYRDDPDAVDALAAHGGRHRALLAVGEQIRDEAQRVAGVDVDQAQQRQAAAVAAWNDANAARQVVRARVDATLRQRWTETDREIPFEQLHRQVLDEYAAELGPLEARCNAAQAAARAADEEALQARTRLADGYRQVLGQVRSMGGQLRFDERTKKAAREAFNEVTHSFPTDWVEASNNRNDMPVARVSRRRAHYSRAAEHKTVKVEQDSTGYREIDTDDPQKWCEENSTDQLEWKVVDPDAEDTSDYIRGQIQHGPDNIHYVRGYGYETYSTYSDGPGDKPSGPRWALHDGRRGQVWRRPVMTRKTTAAQYLPELTTNASPRRVEGVSNTYETCTHELSHRMEHVVPQIADMEHEFLRHRTTNPDGTRQTPKRIYAGTKEVGYEDQFPSHYSGKVYPASRYDRPGTDGHQHYELLSMGSEALFAGDGGGLVGLGDTGQTHARDDEYRAFVLGVFAAAGRPHDAPA